MKIDQVLRKFILEGGFDMDDGNSIYGGDESMSAEKRVEHNDNIKMKIRFYIMSLWLLFILIFLLTIDIPISFAPGASFIGVPSLLKRNILSLLSLALVLVSWALSKKTKYEWQGVTNPPYEIITVKNENYEYLTFLTTYIIPLICIDLSNIRYVIVLGVMLVIIGTIFVKMDLYYGNPTLALMGYRLYRAEIKGVPSPDGVILISKTKLANGVTIRWIKIDENIWVAKEIEK